MKIFNNKIIRDWVMIALLCAGAVSAGLLGPAKGQNFAMPALLYHIGIVIVVFVIVLVGGVLLEQKVVSCFKEKFKGGEEE